MSSFSMISMSFTMSLFMLSQYPARIESITCSWSQYYALEGVPKRTEIAVSSSFFSNVLRATWIRRK